MIDRRALIGLGGLAIASCARAESEYFGRTDPPSSRTLSYAIGEPATLDPALSPNTSEFYVIPALFEGLTQSHPERPDPMEALSTHYEVTKNDTQFTFYLRGHPAPRGVRLPAGDDLPYQFTRGRKGSPISRPAIWSDGSTITAHDFVYSWRRFVDPATAAPFAYQLFYIVNAEEISTGKRPINDLGVRARDDFTFQIDLRQPTPFFLALITQYLFAVVPRQAITRAGAAWTEPQNMVTSGPFLLKEWRRYEKLSIIRNPRYYDAHLVALEEVSFHPIADNVTTLNLYKTGAIAATTGWGVPSKLLPIYGRKKDFRVAPAFATTVAAINVRRPPFDNVLIRYALNMSIDKAAIAGFAGGGRVPATRLVPRSAENPISGGVPVPIDGRNCDALAFDPRGARELLARSGGSALRFTYHCLNRYREMGEILQQQWQRVLNVKVTLEGREDDVHFSMVYSTEYSGVAFYNFTPAYMDVNALLDGFLSASAGNPSAWTDAEFAATLSEANRTLDPPERASGLAKCEALLLKGMPVLPIYHEAWMYLSKPFVQGLACNPFDGRSFKYAWIDTDWRSR